MVEDERVPEPITVSMYGVVAPDPDAFKKVEAVPMPAYGVPTARRPGVHIGLFVVVAVGGALGFLLVRALL